MLRSSSIWPRVSHVCRVQRAHYSRTRDLISRCGFWSKDFCTLCAQSCPLFSKILATPLILNQQLNHFKLHLLFTMCGHAMVLHLSVCLTLSSRFTWALYSSNTATVSWRPVILAAIRADHPSYKKEWDKANNHSKCVHVEDPSPWHSGQY